MKNITLFTFLILATNMLASAQEYLSDNIRLDFDEITVEFKKLDIYAGKGVFDLVSCDSMIVQLDLAHQFENNQFRIESDYEILAVRQRFETSITAMNEGPHVDLINWKHYYSKWETVNSLSNSIFKTLDYSISEKSSFPEVDMEDVKQEIGRIGGKGWYEHVKKAKSVKEYPLDVGISRYYLEIIILKDNSSKTRKVIAFNSPMGC